MEPHGHVGQSLDDCLELDVSSEDASDSGTGRSFLQTTAGPIYKDQVKSITEVPPCNIQTLEGTSETEEQSDEQCDGQIHLYEFGPRNDTNYLNEDDTIFGPDYKDQVQSVANLAGRDEEQLASSHAIQKIVSRETGDMPIVEAVAVDEGTDVANNGSKDSVKRCSWRKRNHYFYIFSVLVLALAVVLTVIFLVPKSDRPNNTEPTEQISERAASILSYIRNVTLSTSSISYPPPFDAKPEDLAVQWLIDNDPLLLSVDVESERFRLRQRYALLVLWFQTNGNSWSSKAGWLKFEDECTWYGVDCVGNNSTIKVVSKVALDRENIALGNNLKNKIPDDLFLLTALTVLDLSHNSITGQIPNAIGQLTKLERLSFANMDLTGTLPSTIGNLIKLKEIYLYSNLLTSTLPSLIGAMTNIETFDVSRNNFEGTIPGSILNWVDVRKVYFFGNKMLGGKIPEELWSLTKLTDLSLRDMSLTSTISSSIGKLSLLKQFRVHRNQLTSTLPSTLGLLTDMQIFSVSQNNLEGTIPASLSNWTNIEEVFVYGNNFTGTVPIGLCLYRPKYLEADCTTQLECLCCTLCRD